MSFFEDDKVDNEHDKHHFIIKYKNEKERKDLGRFLLNLIQKYELKNFNVMEEKAFTESRIIYNEHSIAHEGDSFTKKKIEEEFLRVFER